MYSLKSKKAHLQFVGPICPGSVTKSEPGGATIPIGCWTMGGMVVGGLTDCVTVDVMIWAVGGAMLGFIWGPMVFNWGGDVKFMFSVDVKLICWGTLKSLIKGGIWVVEGWGPIIELPCMSKVGCGGGIWGPWVKWFDKGGGLLVNDVLKVIFCWSKLGERFAEKRDGRRWRSSGDGERRCSRLSLKK